MENIKLFQACPNCSNTRTIFNDNSDLNIFQCSCGKVYCDECSPGGAINLPRCPVSAYHEGMKKIGVVSSERNAEKPQSDIISTTKIGNLEVMKNDIGKMSWTEATKNCSVLGGGWRLPTREELNILYNNKEAIGGFMNDYYLSATIYAVNSSWVKSFENGREDSDYTGSANSYARAVRTIN